jgi:hypothetical protein
MQAKKDALNYKLLYDKVFRKRLVKYIIDETRKIEKELNYIQPQLDDDKIMAHWDTQ